MTRRPQRGAPHRTVRLRFGFELCTPVAESLERDPLRLTILPLIQVAALPRLLVRPPEPLVLTPPRPPPPAATPYDARPPYLSTHLKIEGENRSRSGAAEQVCKKWTLTRFPCSAKTIPCSVKKIPCSIA